MGRQIATVLYVLAMAAVIVDVDSVFFRGRFFRTRTAVRMSEVVSAVDRPRTSG